MISATSFGGITALEACFLRDCGFIAGDCLTARAGVFETADVIFFFGLRSSGVFDIAGGRLRSMFISIGDAVSDVSEPRTVPCSERCAA